jgi:hypothetical protein
MNQTLKGVMYVSVWVVLWGTAASLADFVLLERSIYPTGSIGQGITFLTWGMASAALAVRLSSRFLKQGDCDL